MFAVIKSGGKQYKIEEGQTIRVETLPVTEGDSLEITDVLLVDTGEEIKIGTPMQLTFINRTEGEQEKTYIGFEAA